MEITNMVEIEDGCILLPTPGQMERMRYEADNIAALDCEESLRKFFLESTEYNPYCHYKLAETGLEIGDRGGAMEHLIRSVCTGRLESFFPLAEMWETDPNSKRNLNPLYKLYYEIRQMEHGEDYDRYYDAYFKDFYEKERKEMAKHPVLKYLRIRYAFFNDPDAFDTEMEENGDCSDKFPYVHVLKGRMIRDMAMMEEDQHKRQEMGAQAVEVLEKASGKDPEADFILGKLYFCSDLLQQDMAKSRLYLEKAREGGYKHAFTWMRFMDDTPDAENIAADNGVRGYRSSHSMDLPKNTKKSPEWLVLNSVSRMSLDRTVHPSFSNKLGGFSNDLFEFVPRPKDGNSPSFVGFRFKPTELEISMADPADPMQAWMNQELDTLDLRKVFRLCIQSVIDDLQGARI